MHVFLGILGRMADNLHACVEYMILFIWQLHALWGRALGFGAHNMCWLYAWLVLVICHRYRILETSCFFALVRRAFCKCP